MYETDFVHKDQTVIRSCRGEGEEHTSHFQRQRPSPWGGGPERARPQREVSGAGLALSLTLGGHHAHPPLPDSQTPPLFSLCSNVMSDTERNE